jgi:uncharacterized protein YjbI with pentapeptide repeats
VTLLAATWLTAFATVGLLVGAGFTAWFAGKAFRKQRDLTAEQVKEIHQSLEDRKRERWVWVTAQLGDQNSTVQLAGVHAMADLADHWDGSRQDCIDVLCAYLRMPHDPDPGATANAAHRLAFRAGREVRHAVIEAIAAHLRPHAKVSWQDFNFDFTGAVFEGEVSFAGARFSGDRVSFSEVSFSGGYADFSDTTFSSHEVSFAHAKFSDGADFRGATFSGANVDFSHTIFAGGEVSFSEAKFCSCDVSFFQAIFSSREARFRETEFSGDQISFADAKFPSREVIFRDAQFRSEKINFTGARFSGHQVSFGDAKFPGGEVIFTAARFFPEAKSSRPEALFQSAEFPHGINFTSAVLFRGRVSFYGARFSGSRVLFAGANVAGGQVDFHDVAGLPPQFDWDETPPRGDTASPAWGLPA